MSAMKFDTSSPFKVWTFLGKDYPWLAIHLLLAV
jgi:hypothetical protein